MVGNQAAPINPYQLLGLGGRTGHGQGRYGHVGGSYSDPIYRGTYADPIYRGTYGDQASYSGYGQRRLVSGQYNQLQYI